MPVQSSSDYLAKHGAGFEGQKVDLQLYNVTSKVVETTTGLPFGRAVIRGTADNQALLPSAGGQDFIGVTLMTTDGVEDCDSVHQYEYQREANILDYGSMYVYVEQTVTAGDNAFYRHTATTAPLDIVGRFRKDSGTNLATQIKGATFESDTTAGGLAILKIVGTETLPNDTETITAVTSAISLLTDTTVFDTTLGASTATLADGVEGQVKILHMSVDGGNQVVTPTNLTGGTTLTFGDVGDSAELKFLSGTWAIISNNGVVVA